MCYQKSAEVCNVKTNNAVKENKNGLAENRPIFLSPAQAFGDEYQILYREIALLPFIN